jgi:hypothetical protein
MQLLEQIYFTLVLISNPVRDYRSVENIIEQWVHSVRNASCARNFFSIKHSKPDGLQIRIKPNLKELNSPALSRVIRLAAGLCQS